MTLYFTVLATQSGLYQSSLASNASIANAFDDISYHRTIDSPTGSHTLTTGSFVSPAPRITRAHLDWLTRPVIYASNVFRVPDSGLRSIPTASAQLTFAQRVGEYLRLALEEKAHSPTATWDVRVEPYSAEINGPLAWWDDGSAAAEPAWKLTFPSEWDLTVGQGVIPDNPDGPNSRVANTPRQRPAIIDNLPILIGVVVAGIAIVELGPIVSAVFSPPRSAARANPRRLSRREHFLQK